MEIQGAIESTNLLDATAEGIGIHGFKALFPVECRYSGDYFVIADVTSVAALDRLKYPFRFRGYVVFLCLGGMVEVDMDLRRYKLCRNSFLVASPGLLLSLSVMDGVQEDLRLVVVAVIVDFCVLPGGDALVHRHPVVDLSDEHVGLLCSYFDIVQMAIDLDLPRLEDAARPLLTSLFNILASMWEEGMVGMNVADCTGGRSKSDDILDKFLDLVERHYATEHNLKFYAEKMSLTPKHLSKVVKAASGRFAPEWIDCCLILEAKNLLRYSALPVMMIVQRLHFGSTSLFHRFFKAHTGMTPVQYRNIN